MESSHFNQNENLTIEQVAEEENLKVSRVRTAIARGELGHLKIGALIRIPRLELERWRERCAVPARAVKS